MDLKGVAVFVAFAFIIPVICLAGTCVRGQDAGGSQSDPSSVSWSSTRANNIEPNEYEKVILRTVNENRTSNSPPLQPMTLNASLIWLARDFTKYLNDNGLFTHLPDASDPPPYNGTDPGQREDRIGIYSDGKFGNFTDYNWGENLIWGTAVDPYSDMERWSQSPGHWANIMRDYLVQIGPAIDWNGAKAMGAQVFAGADDRKIDLSVRNSDLTFSPPSPMPGDMVTATVKVHNWGLYDAFPVSVELYNGDPSSGGTELGTAVDIPIVFISGDTITVTFTFDTGGWPVGIYQIYAKVISGYPATDYNLANNIGHTNLAVGTVVGETGGLAFPTCATIVTAVTLYYSRRHRI